MNDLLPSASYSAPGITKEFVTVTTSPENLSTSGTTTGPSSYLLESTNGQYIDKDKPSELKNTRIGRLRGYLTELQDDVNIYLTERMASMHDNKDNVKDLERRILDDGVDEDEDDEDDEDDEEEKQEQ